MDAKELIGLLEKNRETKLLDLKGKDIKSLPPEIGQLKHLEVLDISNNSISLLPREIGQLSNLHRLYCRYNQLEDMPQEFYALQNLNYLDIRGNKLSYLSPDIQKLKELEVLLLGGTHGRNFLRTFPIEIGKLENLHTLNANNNEIETLPAELFDIRTLEALELKNNKLKYLPKEIAKLTSLVRLNLSQNQFRMLPEEIGQLTTLTTLNLSGNQITSLPFELGQLTNLTSLNLSDNNISELPLGMILLENLKKLDLRNNNLQMPPEVLEKTDDPTKLFVYYLTLFAAQVDTGQIKDILDESQKTSIAEKIGPLLEKLFENVEKTHLQLQSRYLRKPINEVKLLIIGQGSVGKTSLVQQILHGTFDQNQTKTEGISINQWTIDDGRQTIEASSTVNGQSSIKLNIWDFGGQEIMHATHQFFLTKRSLYLLVLDARLTQEENRVEYWLKIIQSFGGESPVLIIGNKTDQHPLDIDRTGLQKKYPNIVGILETSAATGAGIEALKAEIAKQVDTLPHVRDLLPETWFTVKSKLEELGREKNFITQDEYLNLCAANDVTDETSQHTLIGFLHDLGVVLHFQDDPRLEALGILNPQWVTNGVYKILNSHELFQNQGTLTLPILNKTLNPPEYPSNKRLFIVDMMKKFELCYDIEPDKSFLIPDLLPKDEPKGVELKSVPAFQYQYPVLPSSIITRFIVRMNKHIANNIAWRTGVVLKIDDNQAVVKADIEDKKISIYIDGLEYKRRDVLSAIRYQFNEIHDSIKGLNPQKRIPIPEAPNAEPLEYDYLLQLERDGFEEHPVKDGNRLVKINVRKLLSGIESETKLKENMGNVTNIYVGGNVGGNIVVGDENIVENTETVFKSIYEAIEKSSRNETEKHDITTAVNDIQNEINNGDRVDESFLSNRLRNLKRMAPDIAEVALATLANPAAGVAMIVQKVAKKIKEETK